MIGSSAPQRSRTGISLCEMQTVSRSHRLTAETDQRFSPWPVTPSAGLGSANEE